jgi:hypothetical protein
MSPNLDRSARVMCLWRRERDQCRSAVVENGQATSDESARKTKVSNNSGLKLVNFKIQPYRTLKKESLKNAVRVLSRFRGV